MAERDRPAAEGAPGAAAGAPRARPRRRRRWLGRGALLLLAGVCVLLVAYAPLFDGQAPQAIDRTAGAPTPRPEDARRVLLVSIDGLAPRVLARSEAPALKRLRAEGRAAERAVTVLPSVTLASHASMLSGVRPQRHGVDWNDYRPWRSIDVPTVFTVCRRAALRCGLFAGKVKFAHFAEDEPGVERYAYGASAEEVLELAAGYLAERDPDFTMVHLAEVDLAGHAEGWDSAWQRAAIAAVDAALGRFLERALAASARPLALIVTSDHGGHDTRHGTDLPEDLSIPWIAWGDGVAPGVIRDRVDTVDTAATVLALLGRDLPPGMGGRARLAGLR